MFNGYLIHGHNLVGFTSGDEYHKGDGIKIDQFSMKVHCDHPDEVDALVDYLQILKENLKKGRIG
jgi:hypothetical protein